MRIDSRAWGFSALSLLVVLAGCVGLSEGPVTPRELTIVVENDGNQELSTDLTVSAPNGTTILSESFQASPGETAFSVTMHVDERYEVETVYDDERSDGNSYQSVSDGRRHLIGPSDCDEGPIEVRFFVTYTFTDDRQSWSNGGSQGICPD